MPKTGRSAVRGFPRKASSTTREGAQQPAVQPDHAGLGDLARREGADLV